MNNNSILREAPIATTHHSTLPAIEHRITITYARFILMSTVTNWHSGSWICVSAQKRCHEKNRHQFYHWVHFWLSYLLLLTLILTVRNSAFLHHLPKLHILVQYKRELSQLAQPSCLSIRSRMKMIILNILAAKTDFALSAHILIDKLRAIVQLRILLALCRCFFFFRDRKSKF